MTRYLIGRPSSRFALIRYTWSRHWRVRRDHVQMGGVRLWWKR